MESLIQPTECSRGKVKTATGLWFPSPRELELRREDLPPAGPGDIQVRSVASAISHGTEMLVYRGQVPTGMSLDLPTLRGSFSFPIKYGYASVGRVVEAGRLVKHLVPGDLVFVHHPHQDEFVTPASFAVRLPPDLDPELGVFVASLETAVNVMLDAAPRLRERVLIFGQGTIGLLLTQLVRLAGAELVIAVEPLELRQRLARHCGADAVVAPGNGLLEAVRALTGGAGADLAIEVSGNGDALDQAIGGVAFQGTVVACSWYGARQVNLGLGEAFHRGRVRVISSQVSSIDPALAPRWDRARRLEAAVGLLPSLKLKELITHRIPFGRAAEAYDLVDRRSDQAVQVVLTYEDKNV